MPKAIKQNPTRKKAARKKEGPERLIKPIEFDDGIKITIYGRSGTGKTTLWSTFPKPILALVCSGGKNAGELRSIGKEVRKHISQAQLESTDDLKELIEYQEETNKFKTVVLDHATGLQDYTLREILGMKELPAQGSWGMAQQQQWGQCALQMKEMLRALLNLTCNVVIIAQEREFNTDNENELIMPYVGAALTPSVTGWLNPASDYIVNTFIRQEIITTTRKVGGKSIPNTRKGKGVQYVIRTEPNEVYMTKFRVPRDSVELKDIVDPSYDKIIKLIEG